MSIAKMLHIATLAMTMDQSLTAILQTMDIYKNFSQWYTVDCEVVQDNALIVYSKREAQVKAVGGMIFLCVIAAISVFSVPFCFGKQTCILQEKQECGVV